MKKTCAFSTTKIFINTIILGIVASFSHFVYDLSGRNLVVGLFNPVNESVWEHLKFMFFPFILWWVALYLLKNKKCEIPLNTWIVSAAVSLVTAPLSVVLLFYSYTGALGIESVFIDILLVFVSYFVALCVAYHSLKYSEPNTWVVILSVIVIAVIFIAFIAYTFDPPLLPIFYDTITETYGIKLTSSKLSSYLSKPIKILSLLYFLTLIYHIHNAGCEFHCEFLLVDGELFN